MSEIKTDRWYDRTGTPQNNILQVQHTLYTQNYMSMNGGGYEPIPGFHCDITPRSRDSKIIVIASLAIGWETTPEWSWFVDRTIGGSDPHPFRSPVVGAQSLRWNSNRMWGYHGGPRDGGSNNFTLEVESYYNTLEDSPGTTELVRYQVCLMDRWSTRDKYINRSGADNDTGYLTRGSSSLTLMEVAQ